MKYRTIILILVLLGSTTFAATGERFLTTAKLPQDSIIWPLVETNAPIEIECTYISETSLARIAQGNWERTDKLITYDVTDVIKGTFPHKQLIFLCSERWPTKESGIMLKALAWPFREGTKTFYLEKDDDCRTVDYFNITAYSK